MITILEQWFADNWRREFGGAKPERISIVKMCSSGAGLPAKERESKIFFMAFNGRSDRPFAVAKTPRFKHALGALKKEHETLTAMYAAPALGAAFLRTVPTPLYFGNIGPETVSVQTALHGRIFRAARKPGARADGECAKRFSMACEWLKAFRAFSACDAKPLTEDMINAWFVQPLDAMRRAAHLAGISADPLFEQILEEADALAGQTIPLVRQHGDFTVSNVSFADRECRVLDFEHYGSEKNPLFDTLWFARSVWSAPYGPAWSREPAAARALAEAAEEFLGNNSGGIARALYTQALLKSFVRKFRFLGADAAAARELVPWYLEEMEALRGAFAA